MSKLTEQWRNGTLKDGWYYIEHALFENRTIDYLFPDKEWKYSDVEDIKEVLAPVPTYEEWKAAYECQLMESEEVLTLKQQLKEAKKILYDVWDCRESREFYAEKANEYFEKWGVE